MLNINFHMQTKPTKPENKSSYTKSILILFFLGIIILFTAGILLTPKVLKYYIQKALTDAGAVNAEINNIDFNPFTAEMRIEGFRAFPRNNNDPLLIAETVIHFQWRPLWHKRIFIESLNLEKMVVDVEKEKNGTMTIGHLNLPEKKKNTQGAEKWKVGFGLVSLKNVTLHLKTPNIKLPVTIQTAEISGMKTWNPEQAGKVSLQLMINDHPLEFNGTAAPFAADPYTEGTIEIDSFNLALLTNAGSPSGKESITGSLSSQGKIDFRFNGNNDTSLTLNGDVRLLDFKIPSGENTQFSFSSAAWEGTLKGVLQQKQAEVTGEGKLTLEELATSFKKQKYLYNQKTTEANGTFTLTSSSDTPFAMQIQADGSATGLRLTDNDHQEIIAQADDFNVSRGSFSIPESLGSEQVTAEGVKIFERPDHLKKKPAGEPVFTGTIRKITVDKPQLHLMNPSHLDLPLVQLDDTKALMERNNERIIVLTAAGKDMFRGSDGETEKNNPEKNQDASSFTFAVPRLVLHGENSLSFEDHSVPRVFTATLAPYTLEITDLDSRDSNRQTEVHLEGKTGEYGKLSVQGKARPFGKEKDMDLKIEISEYNLTALSPYMEKYNGYAVDSGQLHADISWKVKENHLDGLFDLDLIKPEFSKAAADKDKESAGEDDISFEQGISFVRDKENDIHLSIPISGNLDNPHFHFDNIFWSAFGRTLRQTAFSYFAPIGVTALTGAALPAGALWVAGKLFQETTSLRIDPIELDPLQSDIPAEHKKRMDQLAKLLDDRPDIELVICGIAARQDLAALRQIDKKPGQMEEKDKNLKNPNAEELEALRNLAQRRSQSVKDFFIDNGIGGSRLVTCRPHFSAEPDARPLIELGI